MMMLIPKIFGGDRECILLDRWYALSFCLSGLGSLDADRDLAAIMNYQWAKNPQVLLDPVNKLLAALLAAVCLGSSVWYVKEGDRGTGGFLVGVGVLQVWAALWKQT